jgi:hypothetical protein
MRPHDPIRRKEETDMAAHQPGPRNWANGVPEPAKIDTNFAAVQAAVFAKAGLTVPNSAQFSNSSLDNQNAVPVKIRVRSTGTVISVHHDVAIQKVVGGHADLV